MKSCWCVELRGRHLCLFVLLSGVDSEEARTAPWHQWNVFVGGCWNVPRLDGFIAMTILLCHTQCHLTVTCDLTVYFKAHIYVWPFDSILWGIFAPFLVAVQWCHRQSARCQTPVGQKYQCDHAMIIEVQCKLPEVCLQPLSPSSLSM